ncbi:hypothetical protein WC434_12520 [Bordetella avium]
MHIPLRILEITLSLAKVIVIIQASPVPFNPPSPASLTRKMLAGLFLSAPLYLHIPMALAADGAQPAAQVGEKDEQEAGDQAKNGEAAGNHDAGAQEEDKDKADGAKAEGDKSQDHQDQGEHEQQGTASDGDTHTGMGGGDTLPRQIS